MHDLSQREIARALGVSQPTVSEWLSLVGVEPGVPTHPLLALLALSIGELTKHGLSGPEAASIIGQCRSEIVWLLDADGRTCWLSVYQNAAGEIVSFRSAIRREALDSVFEGRPVTQIIALHVILGRALEKIMLLGEAVGNA